MSTVDVHRAATQLHRLARTPSETTDAYRNRTLATLREIGIAIIDPTPTTTTPSSLLVAASRRNGTISIYEVPATAEPTLHTALAAITGSTFARLEDLDPPQRGHAIRVLIATRQTALVPDELAQWISDVGAPDLPTEAELSALDNAVGDGYRGEATHGDPPFEIPALAAFDRVTTFVYDGD